MISQKRVFLLMSALAIAAGISAIIVYLQCDQKLIYDILIGTFSGASLATITALINYFSERKRNCIEYMKLTQKLLGYIGKINYLGEDENTKDIKCYIRPYVSSIDDFQWSEFDRVYGEFAFFFSKYNKAKKEIYKIYHSANEFYNLVSFGYSSVATKTDTDPSYRLHFKDFLDGKENNEAVIRNFLYKLQSDMFELKDDSAGFYEIAFLKRFYNIGIPLEELEKILYPYLRKQHTERENMFDYFKYRHQPANVSCWSKPSSRSEEQQSFEPNNKDSNVPQAE